MTSLAQHLQQFVTPSTNLFSRLLPPALRIILVSWVLVERFWGSGAQLKRTLSQRPLILLEAPHLELPFGAFGAWPPTEAMQNAFEPILVAAALCAAVGLGTRASVLVTGLLFSVLYAIVAGFGFFNHTPALGAQVILALSVCAGASNLSVDRAITTWWRRRRGAPPTFQLPPTAPWGAVLICCTVGVIYLASGLAKLRYGGLDWFDGTTLQFYLAGGSRGSQTWLSLPGSDDVVAYAYMAQPSRLALALSSSKLVCALLSWAALVVEVGAPFFLLAGPRSRIAWCLGAIGFHLAVLQMMGISFNIWMVVDAVIAVVSIMAVVSARLAEKAKPPRSDGPNDAVVEAVLRPPTSSGP